MKVKSIIAALLLIVAGMQTTWAQKVVLYKTSGQTIECDISELDSIVFVEKEARLVTGIELSETSLTLQPDETKALTAIILPEDADNKAVTWESSNEAVATVSNEGLVTAIAEGSCTITCSATDGSGVKAECEIIVTSGTIPDPGNHEWVDLGLPSGTLWATCNVGASKPEEYGDYFAWGETEGYNSGKTTFDWSTYKWCKGSDKTLTKYCTNSDSGYNGFTDDLTELLPEDDAATANWGSAWQMPNPAQIDELYNSSYTTREWTTQNGVNGRKFTSKSNGNSIFLPAAGCYRDGTSLVGAGSEGLYLSRSLIDDSGVFNGSVYSLFFEEFYISWSTDSRCFGSSVRPVRVQDTPNLTLVTSITLSETSLSLTTGATLTLTTTIQPENATNKNVTWESSDEAVATVSNEGLVTAIAEGSCTVTCSATDGSGVKAECQVTVTKADGTAYLTCPDGHHPHAIDLGLPSGTKWCCCNVGASSPEGYGGYYAWGETSEKSVYNRDTYAYGYYDSDGYYYYTNIGSDIAGTGYDAATVNMGAPWRMPSTAQQQELINNCTRQWTQQNGVNGILVTGPSGGQIFLPAAGYRWGDELYLAGSRGNVWSSSLYPGNGDAYDLYFNSSSWGWYNYDGRGYGRSVRAVRP